MTILSRTLMVVGVWQDYQDLYKYILYVILSLVV